METLRPRHSKIKMPETSSLSSKVSNSGRSPSARIPKACRTDGEWMLMPSPVGLDDPPFDSISQCLGPTRQFSFPERQISRPCFPRRRTCSKSIHEEPVSVTMIPHLPVPIRLAPRIPRSSLQTKHTFEHGLPCQVNGSHLRVVEREQVHSKDKLQRAHQGLDRGIVPVVAIQTT